MKLFKRKPKEQQYMVRDIAHDEYSLIQAISEADAKEKSKYAKEESNALEIKQVDDNVFLLSSEGCGRTYLQPSEIPEDGMQYRFEDGAFLYFLYKSDKGVICPVLEEKENIIKPAKLYRAIVWPVFREIFKSEADEKREKLNTGLTFGLLGVFILAMFIFMSSATGGV